MDDTQCTLHDLDHPDNALAVWQNNLAAIILLQQKNTSIKEEVNMMQLITSAQGEGNSHRAITETRERKVLTGFKRVVGFPHFEFKAEPSKTAMFQLQVCMWLKHGDPEPILVYHHCGWDE
ncbi:hypothetical protein RhiJN_06336 [Ceratobasidium sp. AG-Ba]|nr:hypothetical protein RhiJN_06336 [Ceratobasidium sp. AG-Ba]QRW07256.1 hypothetical protein RhiLY_06255 [Ceratobasidium sp. AG-Ba]